MTSIGAKHCEGSLYVAIFLVCQVCVQGPDEMLDERAALKVVLKKQKRAGDVSPLIERRIWHILRNKIEKKVIGAFLVSRVNSSQVKTYCHRTI